MGTGWIEAVLRMNAQVVAAEARVHAQVAHVAEMAACAQDTTQEEALLVSYITSLGLLRAIQARLLQNTTVTP